MTDESTFTWATVTATGPLRIRLDGDSSALPFTPDTLIDPTTLAVSMRVRVELFNNRVLVLGTAGGTGPEMPPGMIAPSVLASAPAGWLLCNGGAVSRTTYAALFAACNPTIGTPTVTIASPGVFTLTAHGMFTGQQVYLTTSGALPTGLTANTGYFVIRTGANTFTLATSLANALAGTAINTSGSQSGTHTIRTTFGVGNGSTTFNVPNLQGRAVVGVDTGQTEFDALGETGGAKTHTLVAGEIPSHTHGPGSGTNFYTAAAGASRQTLSASGSWWVLTSTTLADINGSALTAATGGGGSHNNLQPYIALPYMIKT